VNAQALLEELCERIAAHANSSRLPIDGLSFASVDTETVPGSSIAKPIFALIAQGTKRIEFDSRTYDYGAGDFLVVSVDLPVTGHFVGATRDVPCLGMGIDLQPDVIASLVMEHAPEPYRLGSTGLRPLGVSRAPDALLDAAVRLLRLLDHPNDVPVMAPLIMREITWRLMTGSLGPVVRQLGFADSSFSQIGQAIRWIRDHPSASFRVEDLASKASMSVSTFHRHFRSLTTMSPLQFQKKVRLQQARLLLAGGSVDVAGAGFAVGYDSPSQFSREYRREFGAPPGQDAIRLRARPEPWQTQEMLSI
jgi:AraC-like DNA-binding protein